ncbi:hypothetical protein DERP_007611 [Dermatophagoides pteronyssinus]|uniref:Uncharacterized protein n=1 Tax=Dermatophagoides pteronyssinus TaxID=6956 RepID=A0ABQ8JK80_DERPT|nr:hypothetical protein DERP_007611 [Dermatophagoides pteronyssinus]
MFDVRIDEQSSIMVMATTTLFGHPGTFDIQKVRNNNDFEIHIVNNIGGIPSEKKQIHVSKFIIQEF